MGTAVRTAKTSSTSWHAFADVDAFVDEVLAELAAMEVDGTKGIVPVLRELFGKGFRGSALGDLGYRGKRLAKAGEVLGITVKAIARGRGRGLHPGRDLLSGGTLLLLDFKLPAVEHDLRSDEGASRRLRRDRLRFHPLQAPEAFGHRGD
jgi:hypothetical protein